MFFIFMKCPKISFSISFASLMSLLFSLIKLFISIICLLISCNVIYALIISSKRSPLENWGFSFAIVLNKVLVSSLHLIVIFVSLTNLYTHPFSSRIRENVRRFINPPYTFSIWTTQQRWVLLTLHIKITYTFSKHSVGHHQSNVYVAYWLGTSFL